MTTKEWLMRGWELNKEIDALLEARQQAYDRCTSITYTPGEVCVQSSKGKGDSAIDKYLEFEEIINEQIDKLLDIKCEIQKAINRIDNSTYRALLIARYINFEPWEKIAVSNNYDYNYVRWKLHKKAILALEKEVSQCVMLMC